MIGFLNEFTASKANASRNSQQLCSHILLVHAFIGTTTLYFDRPLKYQCRRGYAVFCVSDHSGKSVMLSSSSLINLVCRETVCDPTWIVGMT